MQHKRKNQPLAHRRQSDTFTRTLCTLIVRDAAEPLGSERHRDILCRARARMCAFVRRTLDHLSTKIFPSFPSAGFIYAIFLLDSWRACSTLVPGVGRVELPWFTCASTYCVPVTMRNRHTPALLAFRRQTKRRRRARRCVLLVVHPRHDVQSLHR